MDNTTRAYEMGYAIMILQIKMWEYEGIADKWDREIIKNGPEETICGYYSRAKEMVQELKTAIQKLQL